MGIKNFLFLVVTLLSASSCVTPLRGRNDKSLEPVAVATPVPQIPATPGQTPPPNPKGLQPVGIFLGPGGMRTFAHAGVLKGLIQSGIPIAAIGGTEWGSVVAGLFAISRKPFEVEWNLMKLNKTQVFRSGLLGGRLQAADRSSLNDYLKTAFGDARLENMQVPFVCPVTNGENTKFFTRGLAKDTLPGCVAFPPIYNLDSSSGGQSASGVLSGGDWAVELRKRGAKIVIYIDVLSSPKFLDSNRYEDGNMVWALWTSVKSLWVQNQKAADLVLTVGTNIDVGDFDERRKAISDGEKAAARYIDHITKLIEIGEN